MIRLITSITLAIFSLAAAAQPFNQIVNGKKQGQWRKMFENTDIIAYQGQFKDDKPYGTFKYNYGNGNPKAISVFEEGKDVAHTTTFFPERKGVKLSEGTYVNQQKEGVWTYYHLRGYKTAEETYVKGKKHGKCTDFYYDGSVAEVTMWSNDQKEGAWKQLYRRTGQVATESSFSNDLLNGKYKKYNAKGGMVLDGNYKDGLKDGGWKFYNADGSIKMQRLYRAGNVVKTKIETGLITEYHPGDIPKSEINYKNGVKHGEFKEYHNVGEWKKKREQVLDEGEEEWVEYLEGQQLKRKGTYKNGKLQGKVKYFNIGGVLEKTEIYENGTLVDTLKPR